MPIPVLSALPPLLPRPVRPLQVRLDIVQLKPGRAHLAPGKEWGLVEEVRRAGLADAPKTCTATARTLGPSSTALT